MESSSGGGGSATTSRNASSARQLAASDKVVDFLPFVVGNWGIFFLSRLNVLFREQHFCDLELVFPSQGDASDQQEKDAVLLVHSVMLHACTDFFKVEMDKQRLQLQQQQQQSSAIETRRLIMPKAVTKDTMESLVKSLYTGVFSLNAANFEKVYNAAKLLKMTLVSTAMEIRMKQIRSLKKRMEKRPSNVEQRSEINTLTLLPSSPEQEVIPDNLTTVTDNQTEKTEKSCDSSTVVPPSISTEDTSTSSVEPRTPKTSSASPKEPDMKDKAQPEERSNRLNVESKSQGERDPSPITITTILKSGNRNAHLEDDEPSPKVPRLCNRANSPEVEARPSSAKAEAPKKRTMYSTEPVKKLTSSDVFRKYSSKEVRTEGDSATIIADLLKKKPDLLKGDKPVKLKLLCTSPQGHQRVVAFTVMKKPDANGKKSLHIVQSLDERKSVDIVSPKGPWLCSKCPPDKDGSPGEALLFSSYKECREHHSHVHGQRFSPKSCEICGDTLSKRLLLAHHQFVRHSIEPPPEFGPFPKCADCSYVAPSTDLLQKHSKKHEEQKNFTAKVWKAVDKELSTSKNSSSSTAEVASKCHKNVSHHETTVSIVSMPPQEITNTVVTAQANSHGPIQTSSTVTISDNSAAPTKGAEPEAAPSLFPEEQQLSVSSFSATSLPKFEELAAGLPMQAMQVPVQEPLQLVNLFVPSQDFTEQPPNTYLVLSEDHFSSVSGSSTGATSGYSNANVQYPFDTSSLQLFNGGELHQPHVYSTESQSLQPTSMNLHAPQQVFPEFAALGSMSSEQTPTAEHLNYQHQPHHPVEAATVQYSQSQFGGYQQQQQY